MNIDSLRTVKSTVPRAERINVGVTLVGEDAKRYAALAEHLGTHAKSSLAARILRESIRELYAQLSANTDNAHTA